MGDDGTKYAEAYENQTWASYGIKFVGPIIRPDLNPKEMGEAGHNGKPVSDKKA